MLDASLQILTPSSLNFITISHFQLRLSAGRSICKCTTEATHPYTMHILIPEPSDVLPIFSDKVNLPASVLEGLVQNELPHPLIFTLTYGSSSLLVGVKEFSASEGTISVPGVIYDKIKQNQQVGIALASDIDKGSAVVLQLLETYDIVDWKFFLEAKLTSNYTTLSANDFLTIEDGEKLYRLKVVSTEPGPSICIVDTDVDLTIQPLNDEMAKAMLEHTQDTIVDVHPGQREKIHPHTKYKVDCGRVLVKASVEGLADLLVCESPTVDFTRFTKSSMDVTPTSHPQVECEGLSYIIVHSWHGDLNGSLEVEAPQKIVKTETESDGSTCSNCLQKVPQASLMLHENFCRRNNKRCSCGEMFLKQIPESHWHCCGTHGNTQESQNVHNLTHHRRYSCDPCDTEFSSLIDFARHNASECPHRIIECRFCHLSVPAGQSTPETSLQNLTAHEFQCGNKTTECYKCSKIVRQRELKSHLAIHELSRKSQPCPIKCSNANCVNLVDVRKPSHAGLCDICFGPSFSPALDPDHSKLQARIERRYVLQMTRGCAHFTCKNRFCKKSGLLTDKLTIAQVVKFVKEELLTQIPYLPCSSVMDDVTKSYCFFCVDPSTTQKKMIVDFLSEQVNYPYEWCCAAASNIRKFDDQSGYVGRLEDWLKDNGISSVEV